MEVEDLSSRLPWRMPKQIHHLIGIHSVERLEVEVIQVKEVLPAMLLDD
jgi:hypothetical protein